MKLGQWLIVSAAVAGLWGCASSERMSRMSGGVIQEYSIPNDQRIRSEKFRKHTKSLEKPRDGLVGKVEETPVNIWPFFFGSEYYISVMWPFFDRDEYGFAVRPFYNQEGDEYSVLFPLSAWNAHDGDGWVLLFSWDKSKWLFFPLAGQGKTEAGLWRYYTPLFIQNNDLRPLSLETPERSSFTECMLGYYRHRRELDESDWSWEFFHRRKLDAALKRYLAYRLAGTKWKVPADTRELKALRKEVAATLPVKEEHSLGFIPLFHVGRDGKGYEWRALAYLVGGGERPGSRFEWDVLGGLGMSYKNTKTDLAENSRWDRLRAEREFTSIMLLSHFRTKQQYVNAGKFKELDNLFGYASCSEPEFRRELADIRKGLKKFDPTLELPETVTDGDTLGLYLRDLLKSPRYKDLELPFYATHDGGFVPLFMYSSSDDPKAENWWVIPAALTGRGVSDKTFNFVSIPLLTFAHRDEDKEWLCVTPPFAWMSNTERRKRIDVPIHAADTRWAKKEECVSARGDYAVCGLFYRGEMSYRAAKAGLDHAAAEKIRRQLPKLFDERKDAQKFKAKLEKQYRKEQLYRPKPDDEVDACRKQLKLAELRRDLKELAAGETQRQQSYAEMRRDAEKLGFKLDETFPETQKQVDAALERLFDAATEIHSQRDLGSGIFYRKEISHNGDSKWHCCGVLAGGEKTGDREHTHILQYLYRYRRDGKRMEKICFPFISVREDEHGSRVSFMGRIWQRTIRDGKTGGYICFIPYGEH